MESYCSDSLDFEDAIDMLPDHIISFKDFAKSQKTINEFDDNELCPVTNNDPLCRLQLASMVAQNSQSRRNGRLMTANDLLSDNAAAVAEITMLMRKAGIEAEPRNPKLSSKTTRKTVLPVDDRLQVAGALNWYLNDNFFDLKAPPSVTNAQPLPAPPVSDEDANLCLTTSDSMPSLITFKNGTSSSYHIMHLNDDDSSVGSNSSLTSEKTSVTTTIRVVPTKISGSTKCSVPTKISVPPKIKAPPKIVIDTGVTTDEIFYTPRELYKLKKTKSKATPRKRGKKAKTSAVTQIL